MSDINPPAKARNGAELLVQCLNARKVPYVFGIPGAKIDSVFDALADFGPKLVLCRHEQNAAFMAAATGRLTDLPGVCITTSGPGATNLATGLATATSEGDPVVALSGAVPRSQAAKQTHQVLDTATMMRSVAKFSREVSHADAIPELVANAFRAGLTPMQGAAFLSLPQDVLTGPADKEPILPGRIPRQGQADPLAVQEAAELLNKAENPAVFLGMNASRPEAARAVRDLLKSCPMPVVGTYQSAGTVSRDLLHAYVGRVGLFRNQPGDKLLANADVVLAVGYEPIEYDPSIWNPANAQVIIHLDARPADLDNNYRPAVELVGRIDAGLDGLSALLEPRPSPHLIPRVAALQQELAAIKGQGAEKNGAPVHPLRLIFDLRRMLDDDTTVICDVGSLYIWMARCFYSYEPRRLLFSNGQQTLGVALPWAIAAGLARPGEKVVSMSGDGGFLFSAMELETAVRLGSNFVHLVWRDGSYDMVGIQQEIKYGRRFGVKFGEPDIVAFAESFGAKGMRIDGPETIVPVLAKALEADGPVIVDVPVDYSDNKELCLSTLPDEGH